MRFRRRLRSHRPGSDRRSRCRYGVCLRSAEVAILRRLSAPFSRRDRRRHARLPRSSPSRNGRCAVADACGKWHRVRSRRRLADELSTLYLAYDLEVDHMRMEMARTRGHLKAFIDALSCLPIRPLRSLLRPAPEEEQGLAGRHAESVQLSLSSKIPTACSASARVPRWRPSLPV